MKFILGLLIFGLALLSAQGSATVWQYEQDLPTNTARPNKAFLWIPPHCQRVRGIIYGQQVILENCFFSDAIIRQTAAEEGLALLLASPGIDFTHLDADGPGKLQNLLQQLAAQSGHPELVQAPLLPIGHSGGAIFAWDVGYQMPARVFALLTLKSVPISAPDWQKKWNNQSVIAGIPILCVSGQYESWDGGKADRHIRWLRGIAFGLRGFNENILLSEYVDAGTTHFGWTPQLADYCSRFIREAVHRRLPATLPAPDQPISLTPVSLHSGWLTDFTLNSPTVYPASPYDDYTGDRLLAFWHLNKELALLNERIAKSAFGKKLQMVSFEQEEKPLAPSWIQSVKFQPEADGITIKVKADFLDHRPAAIPPEGAAIQHAPGPILYRLIGGWCGGGEQISADTFRLAPEALSFTKSYNSLMIMAYHPGDADFSYTEQACDISFPQINSVGQAQTLTFSPLPASLKAVEGAQLVLKATASSGLPVQFIVMAGPAIIKDGMVVLKDVPDRFHAPLKLTIRAWQWGRSIAPQVQTAPPLDQTIDLVP